MDCSDGPKRHSRQAPFYDVGVPDDPILYRLALITSTVGRSLWDTETIEDFITGSPVALEALVEQPILHQALSPGNIFLPGCAEGWEGFVADLELASVARPEDKSMDPLSPSAAFTEYFQGTPLFMAGEFLEEMLLPDKPKTKVRRGVHHDLESFILLLFYAVLKRGLEHRLWHEEGATESAVSSLYGSLFGGHTIDDILVVRAWFFSRQLLYFLNALDAPMVLLLYGCWRILQFQRIPADSGNACKFELHHTMQCYFGESKLITFLELNRIYDIVVDKMSEAQWEYH
ncbi:uncharacterized protein EDB91DRAFT_1334605 [Suillus paluster]|uniref:uncharacterized protein n=1 Tax=Suillus paluster TaxID=48578 RepID=UPI001B881443|nr:uncharacterized protein EDB91DRAFT_1334605 [Suillus paluster]KAG1748371.1 hypothetical protein EDB91DRAFT_1334605 [Suillus paluster]